MVATPGLVYCSVSGYGLRGEDRNRPAYDLGAFWARSACRSRWPTAVGATERTRGCRRPCDRAGRPLRDPGRSAQQHRPGKGGVVEIFPHPGRRLCTRLGPGDPSEAWARLAGSDPRHRNQALLLNPYRAGDGRWFFFTGLEAERHLPAVCRALGRPDLLEDPRFASASALRRNRVEVIAILDEIVATRPLSEWAECFDREEVCGRRPTPRRGSSRVALVANDGFVHIPGPDGSTQRSINGPVRFWDVSFGTPRTRAWPGRAHRRGDRRAPVVRAAPWSRLASAAARGATMGAPVVSDRSFGGKLARTPGRVWLGAGDARQ